MAKLPGDDNAVIALCDLNGELILDTCIITATVLINTPGAGHLSSHMALVPPKETGGCSRGLKGGITFQK